MKKLTIPIFLLVVFGFTLSANAGLVVYNDLSDFLNDTGASATAPFPNNGLTPVGPVLNVGDLTFYSVEPTQNIYSTDISPRLSGNELARSGVSNFDIGIASPVNAFGFEFVEPEYDPYVNASFVESTFDIGLFDGTNFMDAFSFSAPNDTAYFVGVWTDFGFDSVQIRETVGENENEFFGQFYTGGAAPVPEPGTITLLGCGLAGMVFFKFRRKKNAGARN